MKLINFESILSNFVLTSDMLDFTNACYDNEIICIPTTMKLYCDENFDEIRDIFEQRMKEFYFEEIWEAGIIDGEFSLIIWNEGENGYSYRLQFLAHDCDVEMQIKLSDKEKSVLSPIIQKAFGEQYDIQQARIDVAKTFAANVPNNVLKQLRLQTDTLDGDRYRSAWITNDFTSSVFASIENCLTPDCPVKIVTFEC